MAGALDGIKVVDLTRMAPGPFCTMILGDLGADVLRAEQPPQTEGRGAPQSEKEARRAAAFNALNRNKRSIALNLRHPEAQHVLHRLCQRADVLVEGYRPGVVERLGCDYKTISAMNPRIVYCSISGFGQTGPMRLVPGHDINYISEGGALSLIGPAGGAPVPPMNIVADFAGGGLHAAMAILAALLARERTGRGQYVDIAMSDGATYLVSSMLSGYLASGRVGRRGTTGVSGATPYYNVYECSDGKYLSLGCIEPHFWEPLCRAMGREDFIPHEYSQDKYPEIFAHFRAAFKTRTRDAWYDYLVNAGDIAVAKILELDELESDPQAQARNMVQQVGVLDGEPVRQVGFGPKLSDTPASVRRLGPVTGEHTTDVLRGLGYSGAQVVTLRQQGAVAQAPGFERSAG